jgi:hypothetical protein
MKLDFRTRTTYTITQVSENPITLDSEQFRNAEPPFAGKTVEDFWEYIVDNLSDWEAEEYIEANEGILSDELLDSLYETFVEYPTKEMFDSRTKSDEIIIEGGVIDEEYTKYAGFNAEFNTDY